MNDLEIIKFLAEIPLYVFEELSVEDFNKFNSIHNAKLSCYCPQCGHDSIYRISKTGHYFGSAPYQCQDREYLDRTFMLICEMNNTHNIFLIFIHVNHSIMKIGQYPSIADVYKSNTKILNELPDNYSKEFTKALGLFSHGIGIGSFVYLRRILEYLIEEARNLASLDSSFDEAQYNTSRFTERIDMLKDYLPKELVETKALYGIISKGVHELSEEECLKYFNPIKEMIEFILQKDYDKKVEKDKLSSLQKTIQGIAEEVK